MASLRTLVSTTALSLAAFTQGRPLADADAAAADCNCYKAAADSSAHFVNRRFFDFRNIANPSTPAPIVGSAADAAAGATHPYFSTAEWTNTWRTQSWDTPGEGVRRQNSANNVLIAPAEDGEDGSSHLTLRTQRQSNYQSTAEVESATADYQYLTMRMLARSRGASGAVTALFTYTENDVGVQYVFSSFCSPPPPLVAAEIFCSPIASENLYSFSKP